MSRFNVFVLLFTIVLGISSRLVFAGKTYYVSPNGDDGNVGSILAPWQTIPHALASTAPGDTILLRDGTYTGSGRITIGGIGPGQGGAPGRMLTIKNYPGETPTLHGPFLALGGDYIRIEGLRFLGVSAQIWGFQEDIPTGIEIVNNYFAPGADAPPWGIIHAPFIDTLIEGNTFTDLQQETVIDHAIYVTGSDIGIVSNVTIRNNYIDTPYGFGIHVFTHGHVSRDFLIEGNFLKYGATRKGGIHVDFTEGLVIRKNVIYDVPGEGIVVVGGGDVKIYNNTIYKAGGAEGWGFDWYGEAIDLQGASGTNAIHNNIIFGSENPFDINTDGNTAVSHNLYWPGPPKLKNAVASNAVVADPLFINVDQELLQLQSSSPAIDAGIDIGLSFTGSAPDIGAFEFGLATSVKDSENQPQKFNLYQNYPNPFNPETKIPYEVPAQSFVQIKIFDILGREVISLVNGESNAGLYEVKWDGRNSRGKQIASGLYVYRLEVTDKRSGRSSFDMKKMLLLR